MRILGRSTLSAVGVVCVAVLIGGCGGSSSPGSNADAAAPTSTTQGQPGGQTQADGSPTVTSVRLQREGGLRPIPVQRTFAADQAPPTGFSPTDVTTVLDAAEAFVSSGDRLKPMPFNTCCDRFTYRVVITFSDGSVKSYTTLDGIKQPPTFTSLLDSLN